MDIILIVQLIGTLVVIISLVYLFKENSKRNRDLIMYTDEYMKMKAERDKLKVKVDTINRIYKNYEIKILDNTNLIIEELIVRLPRIARKYSISGLDKKYILDLIFMLGARFSFENLQDFQGNTFNETKPSKLTLREAAFSLLDLINSSRLFSIVMFDKEKSEIERSTEIYKDLKRFLDCTSRLILE